MNKIIDFFGKSYFFDGCLGCAVHNQIKDVGGGEIFETENFYVRQDIELPINGFIIIAPKRHIERCADLTEAEQVELSKLTFKVLKILEAGESYNLPSEYNIVAEEKQNNHLHFWLMPRHKWMIEKFGKPLKNLSQIQKYALENLRTEENFKEIENTLSYLKKSLRETD